MAEHRVAGSLQAERDQRGTATAELAVALPAVAVALGAVLAVGQVAVAQVQCVDAARSAARAGARGDDAAAVEGLAREAAPGAVVSVRTSGARLTVDVTRRVRLAGLRGAQVSVRGRSTAALEQTDAGAASVLVLAVLVVALVLAGGTADLAGVVLARHRASAAADLAALAGADVLAGRAPGEACAAAADVTRANDAKLGSCTVEGTDVLVSAVVVPPGPLAALGSATGRARAGPGAAATLTMGAG